MCKIEQGEIVYKQRGPLSKLTCLTCEQCVILEESLDPAKTIANVKSVCIDSNSSAERGLEACISIVKRAGLANEVHDDVQDITYDDGGQFVFGSLSAYID